MEAILDLNSWLLKLIEIKLRIPAILRSRLSVAGRIQTSDQTYSAKTKYENIIPLAISGKNSEN